MFYSRSIFLILIAIPGLIFAQDESVSPINTDRPVQSETPTVIPKKYIQSEEGVYYEQGNDFNCESRSSTDLLAYNLLLKYGLIKNLELRFNFDYLNYETLDKSEKPEKETTLGGVNAPNLGVKYSFLQQEKGWKPNLTLSVHSQFDWWGREAFKPQNANVSFRLTAGKNLTDNWYVIGGFGTNFVDGDGDATSQFYVAQTGYTFFSKLTLIAEFYSLHNDLTTDKNAFNGALVYLINNNHQLDISAGKGLGNDFYNYYLALGYSMRLRH